MVEKVFPKLFAETTSIDVNRRHGAILAIGEIVARLKQLEDENKQRGKYINDSLLAELNELIASFHANEKFRGISGEMMLQSSCNFIRNCSNAQLPITEKCVGKSNITSFKSRMTITFNVRFQTRGRQPSTFASPRIRCNYATKLLRR